MATGYAMGPVSEEATAVTHVVVWRPIDGDDKSLADVEVDRSSIGESTEVAQVTTKRFFLIFVFDFSDLIGAIFS